MNERFTLKNTQLIIPFTRYRPEDVRDFRRSLGASQPLFALFLGVSASTIKGWEQGTRPVPRIACRFMDDAKSMPHIWKRLIRVIDHSAKGGVI